MRIAHVSDCYAPRTGGIETQVAALAAQQRDAGDDVIVLTATPGHDAVRAGLELVDGVPVHRLAARVPFELPIHPRAGAVVRDALAAAAVDVVHVHAGVVSPFAWSAVRAARNLALPVLVTVHGVWGPLARPGFGLGDALTHWSRWGAQLSAVSSVAAHAVHRSAPTAGVVLVVPNGIDPPAWRVATPIPRVGPLRVVSVLRMAPRKRLLPLVAILARSRALLGPSSVEAVLIGDGPQRARAEHAARKANAPVRFAGRLDRTGILEEFAHADVFIQPSIKESFGLAALEARTAGLAVVARSQTGTADFVRDGVEGLLADDDRGMVRALATLAQHDGVLTRIAAHNRSTPPREAWPTVRAVVAEAYEQATRRALP